MKKLFALLVAIGGLGYAGYSAYLYALGPCGRPLEYAVGEFDAEFGISKEYFKEELATAEAVWEQALGKDIFLYNPEAKFKVNLVYDQRQANTESKQKAEFGLTAVENAFNKIDTEFNVLKNAYDVRSNNYEKLVAGFEQAKSTYEASIKYWNARGGAPKKEFEALDAERQTLDRMTASLNAEATALNQMAKEVNVALQDRNIAATEYNKIVRDYNKKYGHGLEFNQAEYVGTAINMYQFTNGADLRLALAHEFGHALGMDHIENAKSIMYYLTQEGGAGSLSPTAEDLAELRRVCKI